MQRFASKGAAGGIVLLSCTIGALVWANSPWAASYEALWHTRVILGFGPYALQKDLHFWVNDFLMALFFFVVGLEIKRETLMGELASLRQASLPIMGALGGILVPASIYHFLNPEGPTAPGWGIPMATDIAFALGVLALLGSRVPLSLKVFLTALAIVDDLAAVLVIAVFYTAAISWPWLLLGALCLTASFAANRLGVRHTLPYGLIGCLLWLAIFLSGVHATIAGVALALTIPTRSVLRPRAFLEHARSVLRRFESASDREVPEDDSLIGDDLERQTAIEALEDGCEKAQSPLYRLEHALHPWVAFAIMPIFALANAGVPLSGDLRSSLTHPVTLGVILGLAVGKPLGIFTFTWLATRLQISSLPEGIRWSQIHGAAWLAGIGFTMSMFIANLALPDASLLTSAKLGILLASLGAGLIGYLLLRMAKLSPRYPA